MISIRRKNGLAKKKVKKHSFLQLSQKVDYGLFLMVELAQNLNGEPISLRTLAEKNIMSFFFLQRVALELRRAGLIKASRGKDGGYILSQNPEKISLKQVIEALEGPCSVAPCLHERSESELCVREKTCKMKEGIRHINDLFTNILFQTTLSDLFTSCSKFSRKKILSMIR